MKIMCLPILNVGMSGVGPGRGPVQLTVDYVATQFVFKFKLPSNKSVKIHWGDGNKEDVVGQDVGLITKTSNYSSAGTYLFYLTGDVTDLTYLDISSQAHVSGDVEGMGVLVDLTNLRVNNTGVTGNVSGWSSLTSLTYLNFKTTSVTGNISGWATLTSLVSLYGQISSVYGDASLLSALVNGAVIDLSDTDVDFDGTAAWSMTGTISLDNCGWTSAQVDNSLAAFAATPVTGCTINIAGTNAHRTAASDADKAIIINPANSNTLTVNE